MKKLFIVESPTKARTIAKYLDSEFITVASSGHIRQLKPSTGSVDVENNFEMAWVLNSAKQKYLSAIQNAAKQAEQIYLATDPDREGEAVAWHILQCIPSNNKKIYRITFNTINKKSVQEALSKPRAVNQELINAYLARTALDYIVGFGVSPVLWRKLPCARSAGRVQSVALRIICDREEEIDAFIPSIYYDITCKITVNNQEFETNTKTDTKDKESVSKILKSIPDKIKITGKKFKNYTQTPPAPFITSTLQQEAYKTLGFNSAHTMKVAQSLYEPCDLPDGTSVGLITYLRTDSTNIESSFHSELSNFIKNNYNNHQYRTYSKKVKNAQEAHECIRMAVLIAPDEIKASLTQDQYKLYSLIWKRTLASQMQPKITETAIYDTNVDFITLSESRIEDAGFKILYDMPKSTEFEWNFQIGDEHPITTKQLNEHYTQPPSRYSESSLIKKLEELGIGRPSTYAYIISILKQRSYTNVSGGSFHPSALGRILTHYLKIYFAKYMEYNFTSDMEENLDNIASGKAQRVDILRDFWSQFEQYINKAMTPKMSDVMIELSKCIQLDRKCSECGSEMLLKTSKFGIFLGCSNYPECKNTEQCFAETIANPIIYQDENIEIKIKNGAFGYYIHNKQNDQSSNHTIFKWVDMESIDHDAAQFIISQSKKVNNNLILTYTKYGAYVTDAKKITARIPQSNIPNILNMDADALQEILNEKGKKITKKTTKGTKLKPIQTTIKKTAKTTSKATSKSTGNKFKKSAKGIKE